MNDERFRTILTETGLRKLAEATTSGVALDLYQIAVGDGNGSYYEPAQAQINLVNEVDRFTLNALMVEADNNNRFSAEVLIPESSGGYTIREAGLFDRVGDMIAVAKVPETFKPSIESGAGSQLYFKMIGEYTNDVNVTISINPRGLFVTDDVMRNYIKSDVIPVITNGDANTLSEANSYADEQDKLKSDVTHGHNLTDTEVTGILPISKGGTGNIDNETSVVAGYPVVNREYSETPSHLLAVRPATNNAEWLNFNHLKQSFVGYPDIARGYKMEAESGVPTILHVPIDGWVFLSIPSYHTEGNITLNGERIYGYPDTVLYLPVRAGDIVSHHSTITFFKNR